MEYSDQEQCFVLQDLNTQHGTYVNDCRVQNAAVRLAPGDFIRFGSDANSYELQVDSAGQLVSLRLPLVSRLILPDHRLVNSRFEHSRRFLLREFVAVLTAGFFPLTAA